MIIVLLGAGNGVLNAFTVGSSSLNVNTIFVMGGYTSMPHGGFRRSRLIELDEGDVSLTAGPLFEDNIDEVIAKINVSGYIPNIAYKLLCIKIVFD